MLAAEIKFVGGRYHATAWQHHVNEGEVEWPPSPWRLLRGLLSTWYLRAADDVDADIVRELLSRLAEKPPRYALPAGRVAHTRHYMPAQKNTTKMVFDTFIQVGKGDPAYVVWDVELSVECRSAAETLFSRMSYLGRAESWVVARVVSEAPVVMSVVPATGDVDGGFERFAVLVPTSPEEFSRWRPAAEDKLLSRKLAEKRSKAADKGNPVDSVKLTAADRKKVSTDLPHDLFDALHADNGALHKAGWSIPPGAQWLDYLRPRLQKTVRRASKRSLSRPTVARFLVTSNVPPRLTEAVSLGERVRIALMSRSDAEEVFAGKDKTGTPLEGHGHAFILPEACGRDGLITHVTLYAADGFDEHARRAMDSLQRVWGRGGHDVGFVLAGVGEPEDFESAGVQDAQCVGSSRVWESRTPFVPTRHAKIRRNGTPRLNDAGLVVGGAEHDFRRLWQQRGWPAIERITQIDGTILGGKRTRWSEFRTLRQHGSGRRAEGHFGAGFRVELADPLRGPVALGYGCHFGLGMCVPAKE